MQLDMFALIEPPVAAVAQMPTDRPVDEVAAFLIAGGWCTEYGVTMGGLNPRGRKFGGMWDLPSRMFQFPVETTNAWYEPDGQTHIYLRHPLLSAHPWIGELQDALGRTLEFRSRCVSHADWWHAVDLGSEGLWSDLLDTEQFTTRPLIGSAVKHHLQYKHRAFTTKDARGILGRIAIAEPEPSLDGLCAPSICDKHWPINGKPGPWTMVHGIEHGWFKYRGEFLGWSDAGRKEWEARAA